MGILQHFPYAPVMEKKEKKEKGDILMSRTRHPYNTRAENAPATTTELPWPTGDEDDDDVEVESDDVKEA